MPQDPDKYYRYCPDQPRILISDAVCLSRRRVNHPWCQGCQFNEDEKMAAAKPDQQGNGPEPNDEPVKG